MIFKMEILSSQAQETETSTIWRRQSREKLNPTDWKSLLTLSYFGKVVDKGNKEPFKVEMLAEIKEDIALEHCQKEICPELSHRLRTEDFSLLLCVRFAFKYLFFATTHMIFTYTANVLLPLILKSLIDWIYTPLDDHKGKVSRWVGYILVFSILVFMLVKMVTLALSRQFNYEARIKIKNLLSVRLKK